ncbi:MAG: hypothetical protein ACOCVN_00920, partial [bacterium]
NRIFTNLKCGDVLKSGGIVVENAGIVFGDKTVRVNISIPLYNSISKSDFNGLNVIFGGEFEGSTGSDKFGFFNNDAFFSVEGEDNAHFILRYVGYEN